MRLLLLPFCFYLLYGCNRVESQEINEDTKRDREFQELMKKAKEAEHKNRVVLQVAEEQSVKLIEKTKTKIVTLENQVTVLKETINEITNPDTVDLNLGFKLLAISSDKENR
jgi:hypothetical protein